MQETDSGSSRKYTAKRYEGKLYPKFFIHFVCVFIIQFVFCCYTPRRNFEIICKNSVDEKIILNGSGKKGAKNYKNHVNKLHIGLIIARHI